MLSKFRENLDIIIWIEDYYNWEHYTSGVSKAYELKYQKSLTGLEELKETLS